MRERWLKVSHNDRYSVSDHGRVRNDDTGYILKESSDQAYVYVTLHFRSGGQISKAIHVLVAEAFLPNKNPNLNQVNHIDGDKTNNHWSNLEWSDQSLQMTHAYDMGLKVPPIGVGRIPVRIVETGEVFNSQLECAKHIGGFSSGISNCLLGKSKSYMGYTFEFIET